MTPSCPLERTHLHEFGVFRSGQVTTAAAHLSKSELCAKYGIQPRDLRKLDSAVPTVVPTILSRKSCIILTMLHLRVVITAKEMTIFDSVGSEDSWLKGVFLWSAEHALKSSGTSTPTGLLPYEFKALEATLTSVVAALENDLANIRSHVVELLNVMENHIGKSVCPRHCLSACGPDSSMRNRSRQPQINAAILQKAFDLSKTRHIGARSPR